MNLVSKFPVFPGSGDISRALEIQRTYFPAFIGLVETLEKAKRIEEAIKQYRNAEAADPENP